MKFFKGGWLFDKQLGAWSIPGASYQAIDLSPKSDGKGEVLLATDSMFNAAGYEQITEKAALELAKKKLILESDPMGLSGIKPLMPHPDGRLIISLGPLRHEQKLDRSSEHFQKVKMVMMKNFERMTLEEGRRYLGAVKKQLGFNPVVSVDPLDPHTTVSDDFNRADGSLGAGWTVFPTDDGNVAAGIVSNEAKCTVTSTFPNVWVRFETALSAVDHFSEGTITALTNGGGNFVSAGTVVRISTDITNSTMDFYYSQLYYSAGTTQGYMQKCVNGSRTVIAQDLAYAWTVPTLFRLDATGTTITMTNGGVQKFQVTDSAVSVGNKAGIYLYRNGTSDTATLDNWQASDGLSGFVPQIIMM